MYKHSSKFYQFFINIYDKSEFSEFKTRKLRGWEMPKKDVSKTHYIPNNFMSS